LLGVGAAKLSVVIASIWPKSGAKAGKVLGGKPIDSVNRKI